jgi:protein-L-isoaspartate(D-aspartate) O-methyltransferase
MARLAAALPLLLLLPGPGCADAQGRKGGRTPLEQAGVTDARVVQAMEKVRRADFLPGAQQRRALEDRPLPIGHEQTTSQPSLIARMLQAMRLAPGCRVLEVGTGSGYQTALLAELCQEVYSVEIVAPLAQRASERLAALGYRNAHVKAGDGYQGWPEHAPFDGITVGAGAARVPQPLVEQLAPGGRLVIPVEESGATYVLVVTKHDDGTTSSERTLPVRFVPLTGEAAERDRRAR